MKKIFSMLVMGLCALSVFAQAKVDAKKIANQPVQVVNQESANLSASESAWLPGQIQDKLKSNLQDYLGMKTVVDSKSEAALKKLQAESEGSGRDEATAIELGKITTAKFAVFTKIRKTGSGYTISIDFTDLTTGEQMASCTSKEYSKSEYLYGSTGAVDELTLSLANKLGLQISELNKNRLSSGTSDFSLDQQLALAKQNEEQHQKMMKDYDAELSKLMTSNDLSAIQNKNRIEAEKVLLQEKQNAEKKRQEELKAQKARAQEDEKLEAERSIALKTKRDKMAKEAAAKAAEVRKLKMEKQGVLAQINVIESKKKALNEIREAVENRSQELYVQLLEDRETEEERIRNKSYSTVELGSDGKPTEQALKRRENQVIKSYEDLTNKFFADCDAVKKATSVQDTSLLSEIRSDCKTLSTTRTVSSLGDELKVSYGKYEGSKNGWKAYLSLYSDGILLYTDEFIVNYEALSGKKAPNMETELDDAVIEEYTNNVDMYNSLLTHGYPIIYFEIDYNVIAESDDKPSQYKFNFNKIRVVNTVSGKTTQTSSLNKVQAREMKPAWDLREKEGVVALARKNKTYKDNNSTLKMLGLNSLLNNSMVKIPNRDMYVMKTEVTQLLYETVIGENPSKIDEMDHPVENVSWFDAVYFCNKLSLMMNLEPVYIVNNGIVKEEKNPEKWNYIPHQEKKIEGVSQNLKANGYRLPTVEEWQYAAEAGTYLKYSGDNTLSEVGWYSYNSKGHKPVATKQPNRYGLYDLSGNVREWCSDYKVEKSSFMGTKFEHRYYYCMGGSYVDGEYDCNISRVDSIRPEYRSGYVGFRICRNYDPEEEQKQRVEVIELKNQIPQQIGEKLQTLLEFPIVQRKKNAELKRIAAEEEKFLAVKNKIKTNDSFLKSSFVDIPGKDIKMLKTEVTQELYETVMEYNPSLYKDKNNPVEEVNWYNAIYFCNKLSLLLDLEPVYRVDNEPVPYKWEYTSHKKSEIKEKITIDYNATGFRLPTLSEWQFAVKGGQEYEFAGSNNLEETVWYYKNSEKKTHNVGLKKPNGYGLYDMFGNVCEMISENGEGYGGSYNDSKEGIKLSINKANSSGSDLRVAEKGFRIVQSCSLSEKENNFLKLKKRISDGKLLDNFLNSFVKIPERNYEMHKTEVTQEIYEIVMGDNPSSDIGKKNPVQNVSWYDAIYFCNKLSLLMDLEPVYAVEGEAIPYKWNYVPHSNINYIISEDIKMNENANGFRLPTEEEWEFAKRGINSEYKKLEGEGWIKKNSKEKIHPVATKKPNGYGLYDMVGNVSEWCCDAVFVNVGSSKEEWTEIRRPLLGENYRSDSRNDKTHEYNKHSCSGFRLARNVKK